jgi:hypothetical protein
MTEFANKPTLGQVIKLSGKIEGYKCTRGSASFVLSHNDQRQMGVIAIAAALTGLGGQAISVASNASDLDEPADYVKFNFGEIIIQGWLWRSPFKEGDYVDVVAEWRADYYEAYAISRPADRIIALYPHCSRSKRRHFINTVKWWTIWNMLFFAPLSMFVFYLGGSDLLFHPTFFWLSFFTALFFIIMFVSLSKKYMSFVHLAERVFGVLGIPDPANVDLVKSSKRQRTAEDSIELGTFYFKY